MSGTTLQSCCAGGTGRSVGTLLCGGGGRQESSPDSVESLAGAGSNLATGTLAGVVAVWDLATQVVAKPYYNPL